MRFSETEMKKLLDKGLKNMTVEDEIVFNLLNFIHCIHLNKQDFYRDSFNSQFFGELAMTFKKSGGSLIGHCQVNIKSRNQIIDYIFTENGFELLEDVLLVDE